MKEIITTGFAFEKAQKEFLRQKMLSMREEGFLKVLRGITTIEEVLRSTEE